MGNFRGIISDMVVENGKYYSNDNFKNRKKIDHYSL